MNTDLYAKNKNKIRRFLWKSILILFYLVFYNQILSSFPLGCFFWAYKLRWFILKLLLPTFYSFNFSHGRIKAPLFLDLSSSQLWFNLIPNTKGKGKFFFESKILLNVSGKMTFTHGWSLASHGLKAGVELGLDFALRMFRASYIYHLCLYLLLGRLTMENTVAGAWRFRREREAFWAASHTWEPMGGYYDAGQKYEKIFKLFQDIALGGL